MRDDLSKFVVAETGQGRGILGMVGGFSPQEVDHSDDKGRTKDSLPSIRDERCRLFALFVRCPRMATVVTISARRIEEGRRQA
jgi:hypothetical protein